MYLSKVLESIVFSKILPFVYPLISHCQFGFMKGLLHERSLLCFTATVIFVRFINQWMIKSPLMSYTWTLKKHLIWYLTMSFCANFGCRDYWSLQVYIKTACSSYFLFFPGYPKEVFWIHCYFLFLITISPLLFVTPRRISLQMTPRLQKIKIPPMISRTFKMILIHFYGGAQLGTWL